MSDLVWAVAETRGMCRREHEGIPGKENSPYKGLDAGEYAAFEEVEMQNTRQIMSQKLRIGGGRGCRTL